MLLMSLKCGNLDFHFFPNSVSYYRGSPLKITGDPHLILEGFRLHNLGSHCMAWDFHPVTGKIPTAYLGIPTLWIISPVHFEKSQILKTSALMKKTHFLRDNNNAF